MTEVRSDNFRKLLPVVLRAIEQAKFIAIDTEFTALYVAETLKPSLFDNGEDRYQKLRKTVTHSIPIQVGLTTFHFNSMYNTYTAETFTFYVWPKPMMSANRLIHIQSSSFQFLSRYSFDYNKLIRTGIPFLNNAEETQVRNDFKQKHWPLDGSIEQYIDDISPAISAWFAKAQENEDYIVETSTDIKYDYDALYLVQSHLRRVFKGLWTRINEENQLVLEKVSMERLEANRKGSNLQEEAITLVLGFTHVFRAILAARKPLIGHNLLMDLLLLENTFGESLPTSYKRFKKRIRENFPNIVDTKCVSFHVRRRLPLGKEWDKSTLQGLYDFFIRGNGKKLNYKMPLIKTNLVEREYYHHAGWDSYCTGVLFIHLAHYLVTKRLVMSSNQARDIMCSEYFETVKPVTNHANLIRSVNSYMNLCGPDPVSRRPPWLVAITSKEELDLVQLSQKLEAHAFVEIQSINHKRAVISVSSQQGAMDILQNLGNTEDFKIRRYRTFLHHNLALPLQIITACVTISAIGIVARIYKPS